ncbi:MAG: DUF262 domain-containing protein, partial [Actinomycetes bacterium]
MEITPNKRKIISVVDEAHSGDVCLPNFQRDFVWNREEVADLLRSVLRGYFVGSLLMLNCDKQNPPFAPMALRGSKPPQNTLTPGQLVLDGQQRLTSLIYALYAPELGLKNSKQPRRFFVDLELLLGEPDDDEIVFDRTEREMVRDGIHEPAGQYRARLLPVARLVSSKSFLAWRDGYDDWLKDTDPALHDDFRENIRSRWQDSINAFLDFQVPIVELPIVAEGDNEAVSRVCAIFEKLNSTGVELSVYDLLTARLYRSSVDLHKLWDDAVASNPRLASWSEGSADVNKFGVLVLRTMALLRDLDPKPKILINLEPKNFAADWVRATQAIERALELIETVGPDGFGVFDRKWLPGFGVVPVLAALRAYLEDHKLGKTERDDLKRWYWCSIFLERYSSAVESKSRRDYLELTRRWKGEAVEPVVFTEAEQRIGSLGYSIRSSASHASSVYSGIFCLLANGGARDWAADEAIALQALEDHHIFPQNYLAKHGFDAKRDKTVINSIVNRTLIAGSTNKRISDKSPSDYLLDTTVFPTDPVNVLEAHFVTEEGVGVMRTATDTLDADTVRAVFQNFSDVREADIVKRIRKVCGITSVHALLSDEGDLED